MLAAMSPSGSLHAFDMDPADGPLDLRFDQTQGTTAWDFLMSAPREEPCVCGVCAVKVPKFSSQSWSWYGETTDALASQRIADVLCLARSRGALP
eukprot:Skav219700  [mRNA]  locus=scaffold817:331261:334325:- [translate_table: standard]